MNFKFISIDEVVNIMKKYKYRYFHIHHTWKPTHKSFTGDNHIQMQTSMRNHHTNTNGWSDIGQHLTLFPDGKLLTGRDFGKSPASISSFNTGALMIEMVGNFDKPGTGEYNSLGHDKLEGEQRNTILQLIKAFGDMYGYDKIIFHSEKSSKTCPGTSIDKNSLIAESKNYNKNINIIKIKLNDKIKDINGVTKDGVTYIVVDDILIPLRRTLETIGFTVGWDNIDRIITIE